MVNKFEIQPSPQAIFMNPGRGQTEAKSGIPCQGPGQSLIVLWNFMMLQLQRSIGATDFTGCF